MSRKQKSKTAPLSTDREKWETSSPEFPPHQLPGSSIFIFILRDRHIPV